MELRTSAKTCHCTLPIANLDPINNITSYFSKFLFYYCKGFDQRVARQQQKRSCAFYVVRTNKRRLYIRSLLLGNAAVNMHPQKWKTVFSVVFVRTSYLTNKRRFSSVTVTMAEFSVLGGRQPREVRRSFKEWFEDFLCAVVQWYLECDRYSSCV
jgi:hypothetical protein